MAVNPVGDSFKLSTDTRPSGKKFLVVSIDEMDSTLCWAVSVEEAILPLLSVENAREIAAVVLDHLTREIVRRTC